MKSLAVLLVAVASLLTTAAASGAESSLRVIRLLSKDAGSSVTDTAPQGPSAGDVIAGRSVLRNAVAQFGKPRGALVGRDRYRLVLRSPTVAAARVTATLPGGTITCRGRHEEGRARQVLRVVAGTGVFAGATGSCAASEAPVNPYGADSLNVYRLELPQ